MKTTKEVLSENLRNQLYAANKTQAQLAKYLGVSEVTVSKWVNGVATPRSDKIDKICVFLHCSREDLFTDHSKPVEMLPEDIIAEEIKNNPRLFRLMLYASKLSDAELDKVIEGMKK